MSGVFTPENPIEMQCPICERVWTPTMFDDCCLPLCGCFGTVMDRDTPCEPCGISHAWNCPKAPGYAERRGATSEPQLIEFGSPLGAVHKGVISQDP